jgi:AcrR family transcriptional regulator
LSAPESETETQRGLPRGRHAVSREVVANSQRSRLIAAMTALVAEKGYGKTTVVDVVARAGVAKPTFYEHFDDKQACMIAAYDAAIAAIMGAAIGALSAEAQPAERIEIGVSALLQFVVDHEAESRVALIEVVGAGPEAVAHMKRTHSQLADNYIAMREDVREKWPEYPSLTRVQGLAVVGAVIEPISAVLITDGADAVGTLKPDLVAAVLALSIQK